MKTSSNCFIKKEGTDFLLQDTLVRKNQDAESEEKNQEPRCQEPKNKGKRKPREKERKQNNKISKALVF